MRRKSADVAEKHLLSIIVVIYKMPDQAKKTLFSLSLAYQRNVAETDYEVIVVENSSDNILGEKAALQFGNNFAYFFRQETSVSPANAVNFGVEKATGSFVCIMIDGARMLTPGVVQNILAAARITSKAVVAVPGYHLGDQLQQKASKSGYDETTEAGLLEKIDWPNDGYRLFDIACFSATSAPGFFNPIAECNCVCIPKSTFEENGGCDPRFNLNGGGYINLDLYKRFCEIPDLTLFFLFGEGSFHQFHGGATTGKNFRIINAAQQLRFRKQYEKIRGEKFSPPDKKPVYLGQIPTSARRFLKLSTKRI